MGDNLHKGHRERMRKRCLKYGVENLEDHEILEILLYYCIPLRDTNELAHLLLNEASSWQHIIDCHPADISRRYGLSDNTGLFFSLIGELNKRYNKEKWKERMLIDSSDIAGKYIVSLLQHENIECFYVICLDSQSRLINSILLSRGTVNETSVSLRMVTEIVLRYNSVSVILAHNHPGGNCLPSNEDIETTRKIQVVLDMINIDLVDHIIVAGKRYFSLGDNGLLRENNENEIKFKI